MLPGSPRIDTWISTIIRLRVDVAVIVRRSGSPSLKWNKVLPVCHSCHISLIFSFYLTRSPRHSCVGAPVIFQTFGVDIAIIALCCRLALWSLFVRFVCPLKGKLWNVMWIWFRSTWAEGGSCNLTDIFALLERSRTSKQMTAVVLGHLFCPEREEAALGMRLTSGLTSFDRGVHRPTRSKEVVKWNILHVSLDAIFLPCIFVKKNEK